MKESTLNKIIPENKYKQVGTIQYYHFSPLMK